VLVAANAGLSNSHQLAGNLIEETPGSLVPGKKSPTVIGLKKLSG